MKTSFFRTGKFKLVLFLALSAVVLGCAALLCFHINNTRTAENTEATQTYISAPERSASATAYVEGTVIDDETCLTLHPEGVSERWGTLSADKRTYTETWFYLAGDNGQSLPLGPGASSIMQYLDFNPGLFYEIALKQAGLLYFYGGSYYKPGTFSVTFTPKTGYTFKSGAKSVTLTWIVNKMDLSSSNCTIEDIPNQVYTGSAITPGITIYYGGYYTLPSSTFSLSYSNNISVGTATVKIDPSEIYYTGAPTLTFKIVPSYRDISGSSFSATLEYTSTVFTGNAKTPSVALYSSGSALVLDRDYRVEYARFQSLSSVGTYTLTIYGMGDYGGSRTETYTITKLNFDETTITLDPDYSYTYNGSAKSPTVVVRYGDERVYNSCRTTYSNNTNAGTATVTVTPYSDSCTGSAKTFSFTINKLNLADTTVTLDTDSYVYSGGAKTPTPTVKFNNRTIPVTDYTVSYLNNTNAGTATVIITANSDNCTGSIEKTFKIDPITLAETDITVTGLEGQTYTGSAIEPTLTVKGGTRTLVKDRDYTLEYLNNINAGTATVTITCKGNYSGTKTVTFEISAKDISANTVTVSTISPQTYTVGGLTPEPTITDGDKTLKKGTDYTLSYDKNTAKGTATITITGIGGYTGTRTMSFTINAKDISSAEIAAITDKTYTGNAISPEPAVTDGEATLVKGTDYTLSYLNNTNKGEATVTVTGTGNYTGTKTATFDIVAKSISAGTVTVSEITAQTYTGSPISPEPTITDGTTTLVKGTHYTLSYLDNTEKGKATVTITGIGNYSGTRTVNFTIAAKSISASTVQVSEIAEQTYTGSPITPAVTITDGATTLELDVDYTVAYSANVNVGTVTVTITAKGNYSGSRTVNFSIAAKSVSASTVAVSDIESQTYTGNPITPEPTITDGEVTLVKGTDYTLSYSGNINAGTAIITVTGIGNYNDTQEVTFAIGAKSISSATVTEISDKTYTGNAIEPAVTVKDGTVTLVKGTHYTVSYVNNVNKGEATVTVTGTGNYTGTKTVNFNIVAKNISSLRISAIEDQTYTGTEIHPEFTVKDGSKTLVPGTDYTVEYADNTDVGEATVTITCIGNYTGTKTVNFNIVEVEVSSLTVEDIDDQIYTGSEIEPHLTITDGDTTLVLDTDYELTYSNNINAGEATVTITGIGNYAGTRTVTFNIVAKSIAPATVGTVSDQTYTGSAIEPTPTVKLGTATLVKDTDYTLTYSPNVNVGTVTVTVTGKGNYTGTKTVTFKIVEKSIATVTVEDIDDQTYTGSAIEPALTLKDGERTLVAGTDYTVVYADNTDAGEATVTVTGTGNYNGTVTVNFNIVAVEASTFTVEDIDDQTYTGSAIEPVLTVKVGEKTLVLGTDYTVEYSANINVGEVTVTVTGTGNYTGTKTVTFKIVEKSIATVTVEDIDDRTYTGSAIEPALTVKDGSKTLVLGTDYTVEYSENINVGTATVTVTGAGNYNGTVTVNFNIVAVEASSFTVEDIDDHTYTGSAIEPVLTVKDGERTLVLGTDYTVEYSENINAGDATVTVTGTGNYAGTKTVTFKIKKAPVGEIGFTNKTVVYDGEIHYLTITGTLPEGVKVEYCLTGLSTKFEGATDVKISAGEVAGYKVTAKFSCESGNYEVPADMNAVLTITPRTITESNVSGIAPTYEYSGAEQTPVPVIKLVLTDGGEEVTLSAGGDFKVKYSDDKLNAGTTVQVEISGVGNYDGTVNKSFEIIKKTLHVVWTGENDKYVYSGTPQGVSARLDGVAASDQDKVVFTVTYAGRGATEYADSTEKPVNAGYYTVSVKLGEEITNYESFEVQVRNFQIEQAELTVLIEFDGYDPETDDLYMGGALPNIKLVSATFSGEDIEGELGWVDESVHDKVTDTYTWQYAPYDTRNFKTFKGKITLNAIRVPINRIEAVFGPDAPDEIYVTTTLEEIKSYIIVTGYFANGTGSTEIKGYSVTSDEFTNVPSTPDVYQLNIDYNGISCTLEVEYKAVTVTAITVTAKNPSAGIKTAYEGYDKFDRTSITVTVERNDGYVWELSDDEYVVEYASGKDFLSVGETYVTISYGTGANRKAEEISVTVDRKDFDLTGITFTGNPVTYDGTVQRAEISGTFSKGTVDYEYWKDGVLQNTNLGVREAGEYTVKAKFVFTDATDRLNYKPVSLERNLVIEKAVYGNVKFENVTADYNLGKSLGGLIKVDGIPESDEVALTYTIINKTTGVTLSSLDDIKNAGTYEISVKFTVDANHMPISDKTATLVVNKLKPKVDPKWRGSLTQGTPLSKVLLEPGENEVAGTYEWKTEDYELQVGLNRCSYVFTPEDTTNYETVTSYLDLTVVGTSPEAPVAISAGSFPTGMTVAIVAGISACFLVAIIALCVALKKPKVADADGFYENVTGKDLSA